MEEEAEKLKELQNELEKQMNMSPPPGNAGPVIMYIEEKMEADARSIYVGNMDYGATAEELEAHCHGCGSVNRVTKLCAKFSGHSKGFAYIEFSDKETSLALDESLFRGRQINVIPKRTNTQENLTLRRSEMSEKMCLNSYMGPGRANGTDWSYSILKIKRSIFHLPGLKKILLKILLVLMKTDSQH
uniref:Polyadenylate-binding protein 2 n=1 Tax=Piliocolobus tephrosceles TaxID=591936 RepID=A0A8C9HR73_9PRIM